MDNFALNPEIISNWGKLELVLPLDPSLVPTLKLLEYMFDQFNSIFFDNALSKYKVVITLSPKGTRAASGWCSKEEMWEDRAKNRFYEINICPEFLNNPYEICQILLHQICHLKNAIDNIQDCSCGTQYHNRHFKNCAEKHGLIVKTSKNYGFSETSLKPETLEFIKTLDLSQFDLFRNPNINKDENDTKTDNDNETVKNSKKSSTRKYVCPNSGCDLSVRATKEVRVRCDMCDSLLVVAQKQNKIDN